MEAINENNKKIYFTPLGGGQEVGASCYFLKLGDEAILLAYSGIKKNGFSFFWKSSLQRYCS